MSAPRSVYANAVVECSVRGCGWQAEIPVEYVLIVDPLSQTSDRGFALTTIRAEADVDLEAFDAYLAGHLEQHAIIDAHLADVPSLDTPPAWDEQEWCDGGTCEHSSCLDALDAHLEVDER